MAGVDRIHSVHRPGDVARVDLGRRRVDRRREGDPGDHHQEQEPGSDEPDAGEEELRAGTYDDHGRRRGIIQQAPAQPEPPARHVNFRA